MIQRFQSAVLAGLLAFVFSSCGSDGRTPVSPEGTPGIRIVAGEVDSDTIGALLAAPLVVEVRDSAGQPARGVTVRFATDTGRDSRVFLTVYAEHFPNYLQQYIATDGDGRASAYLMLGNRAGRAVITISASALGLSVADSIDIRPGARAHLRMAGDTAVFIGSTTQVRGAVVDRADNPYSDRVTFSVSGSAATITPAGLATGQAFGEGTVSATSGSFTGTTHLAVVPHGTLALREIRSSGVPFEWTAGVSVVDLDLSHYRYLGPSLTKSFCTGCAFPYVGARWDPDGTRILFSSGYDNGYNDDPARVSQVDISGAIRTLSPSNFTLASDPSVSRDGRWLVFAGIPQGSYSYELWRANADGSSPEALPAAEPAESGHERRPDLSPDGLSIAYAAAAESSTRVHVRSVQTGTRTSLDVIGGSPRWSPTGDLIAYVGPVSYESPSGGELRAIHPDGTGDRRLAPGAFSGTYDWSPDGKYIVAERGDFGGIVIIEVATGTVVQLTSSSGSLGEPAWKPQ
ncbi:MAG TPA: hypothetical protein VFK04_04040 [Gemmatimonadaceae bacterium]|nr:hypothetical protein [Gemmatimonadaceae bacterium]